MFSESVKKDIEEYYKKHFPSHPVVIYDDKEFDGDFFERSEKWKEIGCPYAPGLESVYIEEGEVIALLFVEHAYGGVCIWANSIVHADEEVACCGDFIAWNNFAVPKGLEPETLYKLTKLDPAEL